MPTSSQALILKSTDRPLQRSFGRQYWRPSQSWMDILSNDEFLKNSFLFSKHPRRNQNPRRTTESVLTEQKTRLDFFTLPDLLKISGIRGSFIYDINSRSLNLALPTYQLASFRQLKNNWCSSPSNKNERTTNLLAEIARKENDLRYKANWRCNSDSNSTDISKQADVRSKQKPRLEMMKFEITDSGQTELVETSAKEADHFKLVQVSSDGIFQLIKADQNEKGSFRLEQTHPTGVGEYRLVPEDAYESDDLRLVTTDVTKHEFRLLQADPLDGKTFRAVTISTKGDAEFHLVQASARLKYAVTKHDDFYSQNSFIPYSEVTEKLTSSELKSMDPLERTVNKEFDKHDISKYTTSEKGMPFSRFIKQEHIGLSESSALSFLPDITLHDSRSLIARSNGESFSDVTSLEKVQNANIPKQQFKEKTILASHLRESRSSNESQRHSYSSIENLTTGNNAEEKDNHLSSIDNDMDSFREKYIEKYQDASPEAYDRLVSLGFRPARIETVGRGVHNSKALNEKMDTRQESLSTKPLTTQKYHGSEWRMEVSEPWSRTTATVKGPDSTSALSQEEIKKLRSNQDRKTSLIDEVKLKANYKVWKKKKITAVRMRKDLPQKDPYAVCVSFRDNAISHEQMKKLVEKGAGCPVKNLQFDPVSIHSIDSDAKSQWILRFEDPATCSRLVETGLWVDGELLSVRKFDDVMKEEHEAYQYFLILNEYKKRKLEKALEKDRKSKPARRQKLTNSHTQTISSL